jgi:transcriptional regulator with XRE-family HTH domain
VPRPNPPRALQCEENLAHRIAYERERRGWTYDGTAKRLTDAGCPIQGSAIYKIEKGNPRRRISVDELVAFAEVFDVETVELLVPLELVAEHEALHLIGELERTYQTLTVSTEEYFATFERIVQLATELGREQALRITRILEDRLFSIFGQWQSARKKDEKELGELIMKIRTIVPASKGYTPPPPRPPPPPTLDGVQVDEAGMAEYRAAEEKMKDAHKQMWAVADRVKAVARGEHQETP